MDTQPVKLRDVFEEPLFSEQLDGLAISYERRDAVMEAVGFSLARRPEIFPRVPGTRLSVVRVNFYHGMPTVRILFTFTETRVSLIAVDFDC